jgi:hypothetical protein
VYSREVEGDILEFGVSGKLMRNVLVMYDRDTGSLWPQILGRAVEGPLKGAELEFLPSRLTTWEDWRNRHPDTLALEKGARGRRDPYSSYYRSGSAGVIGESVLDERLPTKEFVIGVELGGESIAYPFSALSQVNVVEDTLAGEPILVVFDEGSASGVVYSRDLDGRTLSFEHEGELRLRDLETGSRWDGLRGEAVEGELTGSALEIVPFTSSFWFGWKDFYPDTDVFEPVGG